MFDIKLILKKAGISPSIQRIAIYKYLTENLIHPTVDTIYKALSTNFPTLSRTTIYNTMQKFVECKLVIALRVYENEIRYDINTKKHAHFKCLKCKKVFDINTNCVNYKHKIIDEHKILNCELNLLGICKNCLQDEK